VCHAQPYASCTGCHVRLDGGTPTHEVNAPDHAPRVTLKIGHNPRKDGRHPEEWVVLRHAPVAPTTFDSYGAALLGAFDARPTWQLATPHTIRRQTPQNASCVACHGQRALFLGPDDLSPEEIEANRGVVVAQPPGR